MEADIVLVPVLVLLAVVVIEGVDVDVDMPEALEVWVSERDDVGVGD